MTTNDMFLNITQYDLINLVAMSQITYFIHKEPFCSEKSTKFSSIFDSEIFSKSSFRPPRTTSLIEN